MALIKMGGRGVRGVLIRVPFFLEQKVYRYRTNHVCRVVYKTYCINQATNIPISVKSI